MESSFINRSSKRRATFVAAFVYTAAFTFNALPTKLAWNALVVDSMSLDASSTSSMLRSARLVTFK